MGGSGRGTTEYKITVPIIVFGMALALYGAYPIYPEFRDWKLITTGIDLVKWVASWYVTARSSVKLAHVLKGKKDTE